MFVVIVTARNSLPTPAYTAKNRGIQLLKYTALESSRIPYLQL